jgi:predicted MPP superfamily phosphohydrolase
LRFFLFATTFLLLYSAMHLYAFVKARAAFSFGPGAGIPLGLFMAAMVFCPLLLRFLNKAGLELTAKGFAYVGYIWMGCLFLFLCASLLVDGYGILVSFTAWIFKLDLSWMKITARTAFLIPLLASVSIAIYGYLEALNIQTERITIESPKISKEIGRLRIVQISDLHLGLIVGGDRLERILKQVRAAAPDILVSTGDLVDGQTDNLSALADRLRAVPARYGKYAVTGNHEFYAGLPHSLSITKRAGFLMLRGEGVEIPGTIMIFGVDDPAGIPSGLSKVVSEKDLLSSSSRKAFTLLLKHRPAVSENAAGLFDLQLSGHIHGGQIFPFSYVTGLAYTHGTGFFRLPDHGYLYVSRGSGTWGPPIRFHAPPEVTVIDLVHSEPVTG